MLVRLGRARLTKARAVPQREVLLVVKGPGESPIDLQNRLLVFILGDAPLFERVATFAR